MKENNRPFIFFICLIISSLLWLLTSLGKTYETTVSIPVRYTNLPQGKVFVGNPPSHLDLTLKAHGFVLLRHKFQLSVHPIDFNMESIAQSYFESARSNEFKLITDQYLHRLSSQFSSDITLIDLSPDTLYFHFDRLIEKEVEIIPSVDLSFQDPFFLFDSITFYPRSVRVTGPKTIIDTLQYITMKRQRYKDLNTSIKENVLLETYEYLSLSPSKALINIPVSQYTEYSGKVYVSKLNVPDSLTLITFPELISVRCLVSIHHYPNISPSSFILAVDFGSIVPGSGRLPVTRVSTPPFVKQFEFFPNEVEYVIETK